MVTRHRRLQDLWEEKIYRLLEAKTVLNLTKSRCFIISGISGSGKTTLGKLLEKKGFRKIPNVITRMRRRGERVGENIFVDEETFNRWCGEGRFAAYRQTNGVWHGILKKHLDFIRKANRRFYLDKSVPSARRLTRLLPDVKFSMVYLLPSSFRTLYERIERRERKFGLDEKEIHERFFEEINELGQSILLPYTYVVNDRIERVARLITRHRLLRS